MVTLILAILAIVALTALLAVLLVFAAYQASRTRIGYIPLRPDALPAVVRALGIRGQGSGRLYDLGCGDARVLRAALESHPGLTAVGIEYHPMVAWLARRRSRDLESDRVQILRGDLLRQDLSRANYLFTYLSHQTMALLESKLARELPRGSRLVSCDFPLPNREPTHTIKIGEPWQLGQTLYIYDYR